MPQQQIIVAAELTNNAADSDQLVPMLDAVEANLGAAPEQALADAGYRGEEVFEQLHSRPTRCLVALGREGREQLQIDAAKYPHTAAMAARLDSAEGEAAYRRRKAIAEAPNGWVKHVLGVPAVQSAWPGEGPRRVEARVHGAESAAHVQFGSAVKQHRHREGPQEAPCAELAGTQPGPQPLRG